MFISPFLRLPLRKRSVGFYKKRDKPTKYYNFVAALIIIIRERSILINCYKRTAVLSSIGGERPFFFAERTASGWECRVEKTADCDYILVYDGERAFTYAADEFLSEAKLDGGVAVALVSGGKILSFGASGIKADKTGLEKLLTTDYDDEAIAEKNYYEVYDERPTARKDKDPVYGSYDEDAPLKKPPEPHEAGKKEPPYAPYDEKDSDACKDAGGSNPEKGVAPLDDGGGEAADYPDYFKRVELDIAALMASGKPYPPLKSVVPFSRWVLPDADKPFYFGVQYKISGEPQYVCYAVKGSRNAPPKGVDGTFFVPESLFYPTDEGYHLVLQRAEDGEVIKNQKNLY